MADELIEALKSEIITLKNEEIPDYIAKITNLVSDIDKLIIPNRAVVKKYILNIINFLDPKLNYNLFSGYDEIDIDAEIGLPIFTETIKIVSDKNHAPEELKSLGEINDIKNSIKNKIYSYNGENKELYLKSDIRNFKKNKYYTALLNSEIYDKLNIEIKGSKEGILKGREYIIDLYGFNTPKNLFTFYDIYLSQKKLLFKMNLISETEDGIKIEEELKNGLENFFGTEPALAKGLIEKIKGFECNYVNRLDVGIFYFKGKKNPEYIERMIEKNNDLSMALITYSKAGINEEKTNEEETQYHFVMNGTKSNSEVKMIREEIKNNNEDKIKSLYFSDSIKTNENDVQKIKGSRIPIKADKTLASYYP